MKSRCSMLFQLLTYAGLTSITGCAEPPITTDMLYVEEFSCLSGVLSPSLPESKTELLNLDKILHSQNAETHNLAMGSISYQFYQFDGLEVIIAEDSSQPEKYWLSSLQIYGKKWAPLTPLKIGDSMTTILTHLPARFQTLEAIPLHLGGDTDALYIKQENGVITGLSYSCYTG